MKLLATVYALLATVTLPLAIAAPEAEQSIDAIGPKGYKQYYLKAVINDGRSASWNNFYVEPYHTGAGEADGTLAKQPYFAAYLNETHGNFIFIFPAQHGKYYPYGVDLAELTFYTSFQPVQINAGYGSRGFYIEDKQLKSRNREFGGWRVCRWWHSNEPQVFHRYNFAKSAPTSNCADVDLVVEAV